MKKITAQLNTALLYLIMSMMLVLISCDPSKKEIFRDVDYSSLGYMLKDNQALSTFSALIERTPYREKLASKESYVVLAPSDRAYAFQQTNADHIISFGSDRMNAMVQNHILMDQLDLSGLPYMRMQKLYTQAGNPVYACKWLKDGEETITINGIKVDPMHYKASNGRLYVLHDLLPSIHYKDLSLALQDNYTLSLFWQVVKAAGMEEDIQKLSECSVYAPDNNAMQHAGFHTLQDISSLDKKYLIRFVKAHIQLGRQYVGNLSMEMDFKDKGYYIVTYIAKNGFVTTPFGLPNGKKGERQIQMLDNNKVLQQYIEGAYEGGYGFRYSLIDSRNGQAVVDPWLRNISCENGVVHLIDKVLQF